MSQQPPKGIVSPWGKRPEADRPSAPVAAWKTEQDDSLSDTRERVRFLGQLRTLYVRPLHGKEPNQAAVLLLGKCLAMLNATVPEARTAFARQTIGFTKPTQAHMTLDFGGVAFYVVVTTANPETAKKMVIDRIAFALTEARSRSAEARKILDEHGVEVSNT